MRKYSIKVPNKDFVFSNIPYNTKGSREKRIVLDNFGKKVFFKYESKNYNVSEACSEKMCYEVSKILGYDCAKIELAKDDEGNLAILNYIFVRNDMEHIDAIAFLKKNSFKRNEFYTISNIKKTLDELDKKLFFSFIRIMVFDALVGEQDRHEENWGIKISGQEYSISPLYDNGCSLLKDFKK